MFGDGPSLTLIWSIFVGLGITGFFLALVRWWAAIPLIVVLGLYALVILGDLYAPDLYPRYMSSKPGLIPSASFGVAIGLLLPLLGIVFNLVRRINAAK